MEFDRLGAFPYSTEEGTPAAEFPNQIEEELKSEWRDEIMELQEEIIFDKNEEMKERELWVMIEGKVDAENAYAGIELSRDCTRNRWVCYLSSTG